MRTIMLIWVGLALFVVGCGRSPELPDEQVEAAKIIGAFQQSHDPRIYAINARLGEFTPGDDDHFDWVMTLMDLTEQYNLRLVESDFETAIAWYEAQSKRPGAELLAEWRAKR
jgi:hypothetical protein